MSKSLTLEIVSNLEVEIVDFVNILKNMEVQILEFWNILKNLEVQILDFWIILKNMEGQIVDFDTNPRLGANHGFWNGIFTLMNSFWNDQNL